MFSDGDCHLYLRGNGELISAGAVSIGVGAVLLVDRCCWHALVAGSDGVQ